MTLTLKDKEISHIPSWRVSEIIDNLVFSFVLGNLIFVFPQRSVKKPFSALGLSNRSMGKRLSKKLLHFLLLEKLKKLTR